MIKLSLHMDFKDRKYEANYMSVTPILKREKMLKL